ncbi:MAG: hypothetical protein ACRDL7_00965, partial [Gaiellaceae bacterium]
ASDASTAPSATNNVILESLRLDDSPETSNLRLRYETGLNATDTRIAALRKAIEQEEHDRSSFEAAIADEARIMTPFKPNTFLTQSHP